MLRRCLPRCSFTGSFGKYVIPPIDNEPMLHFAPGSVEREKLQEAIATLRAKGAQDIPCIIGGKEVRTSNPLKRENPSENKTTLHTYHWANEQMMGDAIEAATAAHVEWSRMSFHDRAAIFLKAATLMAHHYRYEVLAATMLCIGKNAWQAEIDSTCECIDFLRYNVKYAEEIYSRQPVSPPGARLWNFVEYRPLEGFVLALTPFNFSAIGANLASGPALMGNTVVWKPSDAAVLPAYINYKIFVEAGLPPGVINFVPTNAEVTAKVATPHPHLGGIAFTGSTATFNALWGDVGKNIGNYREYPRVSGETGGKNFHLVHSSANIPTVVSQTIRSAFEYQGQKCSACSRMFVPKSTWAEIKKLLAEYHAKCVVGPADDMKTFVSAVINEASFNKCRRYIEDAKKDKTCTIVAGGKCDSSNGWFVEPTIIETTDINNKLLKEEIFGPIVAIYVYDDSKPNSWTDIIDQVNKGSKYGLTGGIFAHDRKLINPAVDGLRHAAGNVYINDKSTGSVVGQQPFGGGRASGTNDKPGFPHFLQKWVTTRSVKETFEPVSAISYPHQLPDQVAIPNPLK